MCLYVHSQTLPGAFKGEITSFATIGNLRGNGEEKSTQDCGKLSSPTRSVSNYHSSMVICFCWTVVGISRTPAWWDSPIEGIAVVLMLSPRLNSPIRTRPDGLSRQLCLSLPDAKDVGVPNSCRNPGWGTGLWRSINICLWNKWSRIGTIAAHQDQQTDSFFIGHN
jgi:hypothetical protein